MSAETMAVALFPTTQVAVRAEQLFVDEGIQCKLIPTPRHLSATCGMALRFPAADREHVQQVLDRAGIPCGGIHEL